MAFVTRPDREGVQYPELNREAPACVKLGFFVTPESKLKPKLLALAKSGVVTSLVALW